MGSSRVPVGYVTDLARSSFRTLAYFSGRNAWTRACVSAPRCLRWHVLVGYCSVSHERCSLERNAQLLGLSAFPELNVRTYVVVDGKPGVYFFSLDADSRVAVWAARTFFSLPYHAAKMQARIAGNDISYCSARRTGGALFRGRYHPIAPVSRRQRGTLEYWLTERYCLYTMRRPDVLRAEIHHLPWPLQDAAAEIQENTMALAAGLTLPGVSPLLHFAKRLEVLIWPLKSVSQ